MFRRLMAMILVCFVFSTHSAASAAKVSDTELDGVGLILIDGDITSDDVEKFRQISIKYRDAFVTLNSDGGALLPAIEIGKIIKVTGYDTVVPGGAVCASSCALIWTAGATRWLSPDGQVGFHASYRDNNGRLEESGVANALVGNYLTLLNLPSKAIVFATSAPPDEILWLTKKNKISAGIGFEDFILDDEGSAEEAPVARVSPPAIYTIPREQEPLPSSLPASLSNAGENWIKFAPNAYYESKGVRYYKGYYDNSKNADIWVIIDSHSENESKISYSLMKYSIYCDSSQYRISYWEDNTKKGKRKIIDLSQYRPYGDITPGSARMNLYNMVCTK